MSTPTLAREATTRSERSIIGLLLLVLLALKIAYARHFRIDMDEPQHLHMVWGWAHGLLPYRDLFDNHGPIFHLLCSPLFRLLGERPDILIPMRLAMFPLWAISLACVYRLASVCFSPRVAIWAVLFTSFFPEFLFTSTEFRTDDLWMTLWFVALVVATEGVLTVRRAFLAALILGAAFGVTVKSGLMVGAVGFGVITLLLWQWKWGQEIDWPSIFRLVAAAAVGLLIVPLALYLFFAAQHAGPQFIYCNITHNLVPHAQNWSRFDGHVLWFPIFAALAIGFLLTRRPEQWDRATLLRVFLAMVAGSYFTALKTFFPTLTRQDDLPFIPLAVIFAAAGVLGLPRRLAGERGRVALAALLPPVIVVLETILMIRTAPFSRNDTQGEIAVVSDILRASKPGEFVMDSMGESIFRPRPYYYALEPFARIRIERGQIVDDIPERMIATQTALARPRGLTERARKFVGDYYVPVNKDLCILGRFLKSADQAVPPGSIDLDIVVPGSYVIVDKRAGMIVGKLDGLPFDGRATLAAGHHTFVRPSASGDRPALFWAEAFDRGLRPFR